MGTGRIYKALAGGFAAAAFAGAAALAFHDDCCAPRGEFKEQLHRKDSAEDPARLPTHHRGVPKDTRTVTMFNIHTQETLTTTYRRDGTLVPQEVDRINSFLRDYRRNEKTQISMELIDTLSDLQRELEARRPGFDVVFHVVSGYRSPKTNAMLRRRGGGQGKFSRHMHGDAIDIQVPGVEVEEIRDIAWCLREGGIGYYPAPGDRFVHIDTDRVRTWPRSWKPDPKVCLKMKTI